MVEWQFEAASLSGKWLDMNQFDCVGPCRAPRIRRNGESSAKEFLESYLDHFEGFGKDLVDLFCRDGRTIERDEIKSFRNAAGEI